MLIFEALNLVKSKFGSTLAWQMLSFCEKKTREELFLHSNSPLSNEPFFYEIFGRYQNGEPFEYITNEAEFFGRLFFVEKGVLIPRVETEILVEKSLKFLFEFVENHAKNSQKLRVLEVGVGSGIVAVSLILEWAAKCEFEAANSQKTKISAVSAVSNLPSLEIYATDISPKALEVTTKNALKFGFSLAKNEDKNEKTETQTQPKTEPKTQAKKPAATLVFGRHTLQLFCASLDGGLCFSPDLLVSNPPYIALDYPLDSWVLSEPHEALFGGKVGDELLLALVKVAQKRRCALACEMGFDQKARLERELQKSGFEVEFFKDNAGLDRGFVAKI